jgi:hypothetical protein
VTASASPAAPALSGIPAGLRTPLLAAYEEIVVNFRQARWEPSELNGGKLCEIVYTILSGYVDGAFAKKPSGPRNMPDACRALEKAPKSFPHSVRILMPRMLIALYDVRNNRGVGHAGGDVDPNHMDAVVVLQMSKWLVAELVRIFHGVDTTTAAQIVDALVEREVPIVWAVDEDRKRILSPKMSRPDKTLLLLYQTPGPVKEETLAGWVEHPKLKEYRADVLRPQHKAKRIEYDQEKGLVHLSPLGVRYVEEKIKLTA